MAKLDTYPSPTAAVHLGGAVIVLTMVLSIALKNWGVTPLFIALAAFGVSAGWASRGWSTRERIGLIVAGSSASTICFVGTSLLTHLTH